MLGGWYPLAVATNAIVAFALVAAMFALIYKVMPRARVLWRDVWIGAVFTALLFMLGKSLISLYIGRSGISSTFGAAGSLVVVVVWVYYSAQIFLIGAEFTWVYAHTFGSRSAPDVVPRALPPATPSATRPAKPPVPPQVA
jgi:membrane protein